MNLLWFQPHEILDLFSSTEHQIRLQLKYKVAQRWEMQQLQSK